MSWRGWASSRRGCGWPGSPSQRGCGLRDPVAAAVCLRGASAGPVAAGATRRQPPGGALLDDCSREGRRFTPTAVIRRHRLPSRPHAPVAALGLVGLSRPLVPGWVEHSAAAWSWVCSAVLSGLRRRSERFPCTGGLRTVSRSLIRELRQSDIRYGSDAMGAVMTLVLGPVRAGPRTVHDFLLRAPGEGGAALPSPARRQRLACLTHGVVRAAAAEMTFWRCWWRRSYSRAWRATLEGTSCSRAVIWFSAMVS